MAGVGMAQPSVPACKIAPTRSSFVRLSVKSGRFVCSGHYRKTDAGWTSETLTKPDDTLCFEAVGFAIDLGRVYFGVELAGPSRLAG
jgi:hypothetical protein